MTNSWKLHSAPLRNAEVWSKSGDAHVLGCLCRWWLMQCVPEHRVPQTAFDSKCTGELVVIGEGTSHQDGVIWCMSLILSRQKLASWGVSWTSCDEQHLEQGHLYVSLSVCVCVCVCPLACLCARQRGRDAVCFGGNFLFCWRASPTSRVLMGAGNPWKHEWFQGLIALLEK